VKQVVPVVQAVAVLAQIRHQQLAEMELPIQEVVVAVLELLPQVVQILQVVMAVPAS